MFQEDGGIENEASLYTELGRLGAELRKGLSSLGKTLEAQEMFQKSAYENALQKLEQKLDNFLDYTVSLSGQIVEFLATDSEASDTDLDEVAHIEDELQDYYSALMLGLQELGCVLEGSMTDKYQTELNFSKARLEFEAGLSGLEAVVGRLFFLCSGEPEGFTFEIENAMDALNRSLEHLEDFMDTHEKSSIKASLNELSYTYEWLSEIVDDLEEAAE